MNALVSLRFRAFSLSYVFAFGLFGSFVVIGEWRAGTQLFAWLSLAPMMIISIGALVVASVATLAGSDNDNAVAEYFVQKRWNRVRLFWAGFLAALAVLATLFEGIRYLSDGPALGAFYVIFIVFALLAGAVCVRESK